ncbi:MAG TPA: nicotinate-nucleotide--dimethylbenzimidazole phosphoribosyltransferase [Ktedonobacterales bacterium]
METIEATCAAIGPLDSAAMSQAETRQQQLTKPAGSLGRLEELAIQIAGITGNPLPSVERKAVIVMAADHGVVAEGVSAYPAEVTPQMVLNFLRGGAAINALAGQVGARVVVVDIGVASDIEHPQLVSRKVAHGTANMAAGPAMSREEARAAIQVGLDVLEAEVARGLDLVAIGEMGIGNTTAASAIIAAFTGAPAASATGHGTGIGEEQRAHKIAVIERALASNAPNPQDALDVLAKVGGLEIAGLAGVVLGAAAHRVPVVMDGLIASAAALVAAELCPAVKPYLIAGHASVERGHRLILERLGLRPLLDLDLRLGEGTGAALAMGIIAAAVRAHREMATFGEAGVSERDETA